MDNIVIVGSGVAAVSASEAARRQNPDARIRLFTDEPRPFYYRLRLNEYIRGKVDEDGLLAKPAGWYRKRGIELVEGVRVRADGGVLHADELGVVDWDRLLLATGAEPVMPLLKGVGKNHVHTLRTLDDARRIRERAVQSREAVVIGGGLLGLETAFALNRIGLGVQVVEYFPRLLPRQLDAEGAAVLQSRLEAMGMSFRLDARTREVQGDNEAEGVLLENGEELPGQLVLVVAGVAPRTDLARDLSCRVERGIIVDDFMRTSVENILAAGDAVQFHGQVSGTWRAAMEQGRVAGVNLAGGDAVYQGTLPSNILKVAGVDVASAGAVVTEEDMRVLVRRDKDFYRKLLVREGIVEGCILVGDASNFSGILRVMQERVRLEEGEIRVLLEQSKEK